MYEVILIISFTIPVIYLTGILFCDISFIDYSCFCSRQIQSDILNSLKMRKVDHMTYDEALLYIEKVGKKGSVPGLGPITMLLSKLNNPQEKLSIIHVAGTNGKGSICTFLEMLYRAENKRVGRYISPTIHEYLERFQINGEFMEKSCFALLLSEVRRAVEEMESEGHLSPTAFEIETAIAFLYFVKEKTDIVILEVGMGGREDATNVIKNPLCTVFANIGMDHMQYLGDTLESIAYEKAGIIKCGCPAIAYPGDERTINVLKKEFETVNSDSTLSHAYLKDNSASDSSIADNSMADNVKPRFSVADTSKLSILSETLDGSTFIYKGEKYHIPLAGTFQIYNAITAIETKLCMDGHVIGAALSNARWEGRFEKISDTPLFIKDGAHNIQGVTALKESLQKHFTNARFIFIIGVLRDKEYEKMMECLCPMADACFLIKPQNQRGLDVETLAGVVNRYCDDVTCCESVASAVKKAMVKYKLLDNRQDSGEDEALNAACSEGEIVLVAWGSLSYIGEVNIKDCI